MYPSPETPSLFELDQRFRALIMQRNAALDENVILAGEAAVLRTRVADLEHQLAELTPEPPAVDQGDTDDVCSTN